MKASERRRGLLLPLFALAGGILLFAGSAEAVKEAQIQVEQAKVKFSEGLYAEALSLLEQALAEDPDNADALHYAGLCEMTLKRPEKAFAHLGKAARLLPKDAGVQEDLAWAGVETKRFEQALAAAEQALALKPESERARLLKGEALLGMGRYDEALVELQRVSETGPYGQAAIFYQGVALVSWGKTAEASERFERAAQMNPGTEIGQQAAEYAAVLAGKEVAPEKEKPWELRFRVMYQYDTNMALTEDEDILPEDVTNKEDGRAVVDLDARYMLVEEGGFRSYVRYVGYATFQFQEPELNIFHNIAQLVSFYQFEAGVPMQIGIKGDYAHSTLEGYWYESFYKVSPEWRVMWSPNFMTRLVGDWKEETFEEPGEHNLSRNNKMVGGTLYAHFSALDGALNGWAGYGYSRWMGAGENYRRYQNSGILGLVGRWPAEIKTTLLGRYDAIVYPDFHPGDRKENKTSVNLSAEIPLYQDLKAYVGAAYTTVDANEERYEYERWIYSAGVFVEL